MKNTNKSNNSIYPSIPANCFDKVSNILNSGALYRYSNDTNDLHSETTLFEQEIANYLGVKYALGVNSCGMALNISLLCCGVKPNDKVLCSGFTFNACPSAIVAVGAIPILVECNENYCTDIDDLKKKISPDINFFLISHMRGNISEMDKILEICNLNNITLIEDCAHSLGCYYNNIHTGLFGKVGCLSTQSHKIINSGEGGVIFTNDEELIVKAIIYAGCTDESSWQFHLMNSQYFGEYIGLLPNLSVRMSNITALLLREQISYINEIAIKYKENYQLLKSIISKSLFINIPTDYNGVTRIPDSIQFNLVNFREDERDTFIDYVCNNNVNIKIFGNKKNSRFYKNWKFIPNIQNIHLPNTELILQFACDLRLPLNLEKSEIKLIGDLILTSIDYVKKTNSNLNKCKNDNK